jgi:hypothetical protein
MIGRARPLRWPWLMARKTPVRPALSDTLSVILPTSEQTSFLRACLHSGEMGRRAWQAWREQNGESVRLLEKRRPAVKSLLPLLFYALRRNGVAVEPALLTVLRTAYVQEELRGRTYRRILGDVLELLAMEGVAPIVLKGAALASTVYPDPALRHSHDIDLLVKDRELSDAADAVPLAGFRVLSRRIGSHAAAVELEHVSGLPLHLRTRPFRIPHHNALSADFWHRSREAPSDGRPMRVLSPADNLLHVCGLASSRTSHSLRWVSDAWYIVHSRADLDWEVVVRDARQGQLALPLYVILRYLAADMQAPIPTPILDRLADAASHTSMAARETALYGARVGGGGTFRNLLRQSRSWRSRARLVQWMLAPSPGYIRWIHGAGGCWPLALHYLYRPLRYFARRISWRFGTG